MLFDAKVNWDSVASATQLYFFFPAVRSLPLISPCLQLGKESSTTDLPH